MNALNDIPAKPNPVWAQGKSEVIFQSRHYTASAMRDGSLIVQRHDGTGTRLVNGAQEWIEAIKTAINHKEAAALCRAIL